MAEENTLVSIVTPNFNMAEFLEETILSVLNQDYLHIEYIVIDGGSTDGSIDVIRKYEDRITYWVSEKDSGAAEAINKGWRRSTGELLWMLPSDDVLPPGSISSTVKYLHENPDIDFVYGDCYVIDAESRVLAVEHYGDFNLLRFITGLGITGPDSRQPCMQGCLMRRRILQEVGYLDETLYRGNDLDYCIRIGLYHRFGYLPEPLGCMRAHQGSPTFSGALGHIFGRDIIRIYHKLYSRLDLPQELAQIRRKAWAGAHHASAGSYFRCNHSRRVLEHLLLAGRLDPSRLFMWSFIRLFLTALLGDTGMRIARLMYRRIRPDFTGGRFSPPPASRG